ncbi:PAS domain-containing sensor histidine kinase [Nocardioides sp. C4-1]|uniref:PAS domain-containing sensor histidine kinase n=1 Tax=Nocardioides sp. C4-1 TaxID=3151851 RepID=UPI003265A27A
MTAIGGGPRVEPTPPPPPVPPGLLDHVPDAYVSVDASGRVVTWNDRAVAVFGWSLDEVRARGLADLLLSSRRAALHRRQVDDFRTTGMSGILGRHRAVPMSTRDGRLLRVDCVVWPAVDAGGRTTLHCLMDDVTARFDEVAAMRRAADDVGAFSAAMAHDLRAPLAVVKGYVELLREHLDGGPADLLAGHIDVAADRGVALIDDILRYLGIGRVLAVREPVDLDALVGRVVGEQVQSAGRPVTIDVHRLPVVRGDERLLGQLFGNLLGNAVKHVPDDRDVMIVVDAVLDPAWETVTVRVHDNGDPIPEADRRRIFAMFQRGAATTATGSGVGLAVSHRIAELHDGRIDVETPDDGGNRFCVRLGS